MVPKDKVTLRNLAMVIVVSTAVALLIGISCLRLMPHPAIPENESVRSSAGGVPVATPAPVPTPAPAVGTTRITSSERERGSSASGTPEVEPTTKRQAGNTPYETPPPEPSARPVPSATTIRRYVQSAPAVNSAAAPTEEIEAGSIIVEDAGPPSGDASTDAAIPLADAAP